MKSTATFLLTTFFLFFQISCDKNKQIIGGKTKITEVREFTDSINFSRIQSAIDHEESREEKRFASVSDLNTNQDLVGYGFNSSTLTPTGKVVVNNNNLFDTTSFSSGGQEVTKILERVTTKSSLYDKLGIDIKASVKYGVYKGSASLQMLDESSINNYSDYLLLKVTVTNGPLILKESKLTVPAKSNANKKDLFFERYGNEFFYGKVTGGEFCCLFEFSSSSISSRKSIKAGIELAMKTFFASGDFSLSMEKLNTALDERTTTKIKFYRLGDDGKLAADQVDSLIKYANEFPEKVKSNSGKSVVLRLLSKPILYIDDLLPSFRANDFLIFNKQNYYLDSLSKEISKVQDINANYNYVIDNSNQEFFSLSAIDSAKTFLNLNNKSIDKMKQLFFNCITSIQNCSTLNTNKVVYQSYIPKSSMYENSENQPIEIKDLVLTNDELLITEVPFGVTKTIEFRGNWKMNSLGDQLNNLYDKDRHCGLPATITYQVFPNNPYSIVFFQARVKIIQKNIATDQIIDESLWDGNKPFTTRSGVKVYTKPEFSITQCEPPVTGYIY